MRRRVKDREEREAPRTTPAGEKVIIPHDPVNEIAVLTAALADHALLDQLLRKLLPDHFQTREAREAWTVLGEVRRRGLEVDRGSVSAIGGEHVMSFLITAAGIPIANNAAWHVQNLLWDSARATAARGPVPAFLEAFRDPKAEPERVRSLARQVAASFDGYEDRKYLADPKRLVREQMLEIEQRALGHAVFPYGIRGLDFLDDGVRRRMIPGTAPGQVTTLTGVSGGGKSTTVANMVLGMAFPDGIDSDAPGRRVCYGAWEMRAPMTLELLACVSLGWSRTELMEGVGEVTTREGRIALEERMHRIASRVQFLAMPFKRKAGEKGSNDRNLDILQGYLSDAACEVFVADLWKRILRDASPEAEEDALVRQQSMVEDLRIHAILLQQQRLKDVEQREDKRPTREGIKGSGAWVEVSDTIIGVHRPALWKRIEDVRLEMLVLKQRYGKWPLAVEFEWDPEEGKIRGGRHVDYDRPGEVSDMDATVGAMARPGNYGGPAKRKSVR